MNGVGKVSTRFGGPGETIPGDRCEGPAAWPFSLQPRDVIVVQLRKSASFPAGWKRAGPPRTISAKGGKGDGYEAVEESITGNRVDLGHERIRCEQNLTANHGTHASR